MAAIFDNQKKEELTKKFELITEETPAKWGKMNAAQMFQHLNKALDGLIHKQAVKRMFLGRFLGKLILKKALKGKYLAKNSPTAPEYISDKSVNFTIEKKQWLESLNTFSTITESDLEGAIHPFFGKMTGKEWRILIEKHTAHHLNQFS